MSNLPSIRKTIAERVTKPMVSTIAKTPLTPNVITWIGFVIIIAAGVLVATEHLLAGGIVVLVAGLFDMLDGALARLTNKTTRFGAILDSTLDRLSEAIILITLLAVFTRNGQVTESVLAGVTLAGSFMTSYIRARAEGLGIEMKEGLFTRPERVIILSMGLLFSGFNNVLLITLSIITFFSWLTVVERMVYARRKLKEEV
jgi:CDP-diacylglycerol--glycerol-3-phosphate 3-phosphatidyltransferase